MSQTIDDLGFTIDDLAVPAAGPCVGSSIVNRQSSILVFTLLCLLIPLFAQQPEDALIREALSDYQSGQLETAIAKLRQARDAQPDNAFARLYLGLFLHQKDAGSIEARDLMESVLDRFPSNPDLLLRLTDSYLSSDKTDKLSTLLERSKSARASNSRLALNTVYLLVRYARLDQATLALDEITAASRSLPEEKPDAELGEVCFLRGLIAATAGQKDLAMRQFQAADKNEFPPRDSPQMKMLADAFYRFEEYALAAQAYQVYLAHSPQDADARLQLAISYFSSVSFTRAREEFRRVYEQAPKMPQINYYMGRVFLESKDHEGARRSFETELRVDPKSYPAMAELAYLDYASGDNVKCLNWLKKAAALSPDYSEVHFVYGLLHNRQGKYALAIEDLEKVIQSNPKHIKAQFQLSVAYRRIGNEAKAREHAGIYDKLLEEHRKRMFGEDVRR